MAIADRIILCLVADNKTKKVIMCTAIRFGKRYFGRTLDFERGYGEEIVIVKRGALRLLDAENRYAIMGVGVVKSRRPLYFDGVNEWGLCGAALNFPTLAVYCDKCEVGTAISSSQLISFALGFCRSVSEVREMLEKICISDEGADENTPPTPLHWIFADGREAITVESVKEGLRVYDNPIGVLTNAPDFNYHMTRLADFAALQAENPDRCFTHSPPYSRGMGAIGLPGDFSSSSRFVRAAFIKENMKVAEGEEGDVSRIFSAIAPLEVPPGCVLNDEGEAVVTRYTAVIDMENPTYYLTTSACRTIRSISLSDIDESVGKIYSVPFYCEEKIERILDK